MDDLDDYDLTDHSPLDHTFYWHQARNPPRIANTISKTPTKINQLLFTYRRIIVAQENGIILIYSPSLELTQLFKGHTASVRCVISTRSKLISGSDDSTVRIWTLVDGHCLHVFRGHQGPISCMKLIMPSEAHCQQPFANPQPRRRLLLTGSADHTAMSWILPILKEPEYGLRVRGRPPPDPTSEANPYFLMRFTGHTGPIRCVAALGNVIVTGSDDCTVQVYDAENGVLLFVLRESTGPISALEIDHQFIYYGSRDSTLQFWDRRTGRHHITSDIVSTIIFAAPLSGGENQVITAGDNGLNSCVKIWHFPYQYPTQTMYTGQGKFCDIAADAYKILVCTEQVLQWWEPQTGRLVETLYQCRDQEKLSHVAFEGQLCAFTHKDKEGCSILTIIDFRPSEKATGLVAPSRDELFDSDYEVESIIEAQKSDKKQWT